MFKRFGKWIVGGALAMVPAAGAFAQTGNGTSGLPTGLYPTDIVTAVTGAILPYVTAGLGVVAGIWGVMAVKRAIGKVRRVGQ